MHFWGSFGNQLLFSLLLALGLLAYHVHSSALGLETSPKPRGVRPPSPPKQSQGSILSGKQRNYTFYSTYGSAYDVAKRCSQNPGVLVPLPLVSWVLPDILSAIRSSNKDNLLNAIQNGIWVLDPWGGCRSATVSMDSSGSVPDFVMLRQESCSLQKLAICMSYDVVQNDIYAQQALTTYNRYWTPKAPMLPAAVPIDIDSHTNTSIPPDGFHFVDGMVLGREPDSGVLGSKDFSGSTDFVKFGPVVNIITRWKPDGLSELACVYAKEEFDEDEELLDLEQGLVGFPFLREDSFQSQLRTSYIVRVEGCVGPNTIQRLMVTTAIGASYAMGTGPCTANFLEEAPTGGYLAYMRWTRGPEPDATSPNAFPPLYDSSPPIYTSIASPRVRKLQMVWAVPQDSSVPSSPSNTNANSLRQVFPPLDPVVPQPDCSEARGLLPLSPSPNGDDSTCGTNYACPSYMCCVRNGGDRSGNCVSGPELCRSADCDSKYGLCEGGPWQSVFFAAHEGFPVSNTAAALGFFAPPSSPIGGVVVTSAAEVAAAPSGAQLNASSRVDTAPVRNATVMYAMLEAAGVVNYSEAMDLCGALSYLGLTWRIIDIGDALAFENSLLLSEKFITKLSDTFKWVWLSWRGGNCIRARWKVWDGQTQLAKLESSKCSSEAAAVICRATWPGLTGYTPDVGSRQATVRFTPGSHNLSVSHAGDGIALSGATCKGTSVCVLKSDEDEAKVLSQTLWELAVEGSPVPLQGPPLDLNSPLAALALRPLTTWSVVDDQTVTYDTIAALAIQYYSPVLSPTSLPSTPGVPITVNTFNQTLAALEPLFLGSLDGTAEEEDQSDSLERRRVLSDYMPYEAGWRALTLLSDSEDNSSSTDTETGTDNDDWGLALSQYVSYDAGWRTLSLDVASGEVVVEVSGCRGGLLEQLVLRTSAGRLLSSPAGPGFVCSVPFSLAAPEGGYMVAMQVHAGSYLEELQVVWGTPTQYTPPPAEHPFPGPLPNPKHLPSPSPVEPPFEESEMDPPLVRFLSPSMPSSPPPAGPVRSPVSPSPAVDKGQPAAAVDDGGHEVEESSPPSRSREEPKYMSPLPTQQPQRPAGVGPLGGAVKTSKLGVGAGVGVGVGLSAVAVAAVLIAVWMARRRGRCGGRARGSSSGGGSGGGGTRKEAAADGVVAGRRRGDGGGGGGRGRGNWDTFSALPFEAARRLSSTSSGGGGRGGGGGGVALSAVVVDGAKPIPGMGPVANKIAPAPSITPSLGDSTESSGGGGPGFARGSPERISRQHHQGLVPPPPDSKGAFTSSSGRTNTAGRGSGGVGGAAPAVAGGGGPPAAGGDTSPIGTAAPVAQAGLGGLGRSAAAGSLEQQMHAALFQKALYVARPYAGWESAGGKPGDPSPDPYSVLGAGAATGTTTSTASGTALSASTGPTTLSSPPPRPGAGVGRLSGGTPLGPAASTAAGAATADSDVVTEEGVGVGAGGGTQSQGQHQYQHSQGQQQQQQLRAIANAAAAPAPSVLVGGVDTSGEGDGGGGGDGRGDVGAGGAAADAGEGGSGGGPAGAPLSMAVHGSVGQLGGSGAAGGGAAELLLGRDVIVNVDDPATYLGHGTSGVVRRGALRQSDGSWRPVAVKLLNTPPGETAADWYNRHLRTLVQEVTILGSLCHPNIVQLLGGCLNPGASFLVEELCGGTLSHAIYDASMSYDLSQLLRWSADIAAGLAFLHPHIMHRDLKPSNVLLDEGGTAKISDFGLARFKAHTTLHTKDAEVGTTCYMAPECFVSTDVKVTAACDVYSLGVLINEMATRTRPWSGTRTAVVGFKVAVVGERPELPHPDSALCPPPLRQLIIDCWAQQPSDRPNSAQVLLRLRDLLAQAETGGPVGGSGAVGRDEPSQQGRRLDQGHAEADGKEGEKGEDEALSSKRPSRERGGSPRQAPRPPAAEAGTRGGFAGRRVGAGSGLKEGRGVSPGPGEGTVGTDCLGGGPAAETRSMGEEERSSGGR